MKRIAVVGGGPAGLTAAWRASRAGAAVTLYEADAELGGRLRTDSLDGFRVDYAVQLLASTYATVFRLAEEAGVRDLLVRAPGRDALWRGGRPHALQYGSVASLVASTALPASLKLRMGVRYLPYLGSTARGLDANDPARTGGVALDVASVAEWGGSVLGRDFVELMAYPLLGAYYGAEPEQMSVALYHALARVGRSVEVYAAAGGMGEFAAALGEALAVAGCIVRAGERVDAVSADGNGAQVSAGGSVERYDACVVAVPGSAVADLITAPSQLAGWLASIRTVPALTLALLIDAPLGLDFFGLSFPRESEVGDRLVAVCVESAKGGGLVPADKDLLVVYPAPSRIGDLTMREPADIVDELLPAVESVFPRIEGRVERARVYRIAGGHTLFYPGYLRHLAGYDPDWLPPRVALAGEYLAAPTVEGAALSGARAAARVLERSR